MSQFNRQELINAEIEVSRATWMMNQPGESPPKPCDSRYVVECIRKAILDLQLSIGDITREQHKAGYNALKPKRIKRKSVKNV